MDLDEITFQSLKLDNNRYCCNHPFMITEHVWKYNYVAFLLFIQKYIKIIIFLKKIFLTSTYQNNLKILKHINLKYKNKQKKLP